MHSCLVSSTWDWLRAGCYVQITCHKMPMPSLDLTYRPYDKGLGDVGRTGVLFVFCQGSETRLGYTGLLP